MRMMQANSDTAGDACHAMARYLRRPDRIHPPAQQQAERISPGPGPVLARVQSHGGRDMWGARQHGSGDGRALRRARIDGLPGAGAEFRVSLARRAHAVYIFAGG